MRTTRPRRYLSLLLAALLMVAPARALAGFAFLDERGAQTLLSSGRIKYLSPTAEDPVVVLDAGRGRMWIANPRARAYWGGTVDEFCASVKAMLGGAMSPEVETMLREKTSGLTPEQQEMARQMMKSAMAQQGRQPGAESARVPRVTVESTGDTETIAGLPTRKFRVVADGKLQEEVWLTNDPAVTREFDLSRAPQTIAKLSACHGPRPSQVQDTDAYRQLFTQGWPLKSVTHGGGFSRPNVVRTERREIADTEFVPPLDYKKLPLVNVLMKR